MQTSPFLVLSRQSDPKFPTMQLAICQTLIFLLPPLGGVSGIHIDATPSVPKYSLFFTFINAA
jgi:hypothetical protein